MSEPFFLRVGDDCFSLSVLEYIETEEDGVGLYRSDKDYQFYHGDEARALLAWRDAHTLDVLAWYRERQKSEEEPLYDPGVGGPTEHWDDDPPTFAVDEKLRAWYSRQSSPQDAQRRWQQRRSVDSVVDGEAHKKAPEHRGSDAPDATEHVPEEQDSTDRDAAYWARRKRDIEVEVYGWPDDERWGSQDNVDYTQYTSVTARLLTEYRASLEPEIIQRRHDSTIWWSKFLNSEREIWRNEIASVEADCERRIADCRAGLDWENKRITPTFQTFEQLRTWIQAVYGTGAPVIVTDDECERRIEEAVQAEREPEIKQRIYRAIKDTSEQWTDFLDRERENWRTEIASVEADCERRIAEVRVSLEPEIEQQWAEYHEGQKATWGQESKCHIAEARAQDKARLWVWLTKNASQAMSCEKTFPETDEQWRYWRGVHDGHTHALKDLDDIYGTDTPAMVSEAQAQHRVEEAVQAERERIRE